MAVMLVALTVFVAVLFGYLANRAREKQPAETRSSTPVKIDKVDGLALAQGLFYHPMHTWVHKLDFQTALVGIDDLARHLIGRVDKVLLPFEGAEMEAGQSCARMGSGRRFTAVLSPLAGEVMEVNPAVKENPNLVSDDPYGQGWLFKIKSWRLKEQLNALLRSDFASDWTKMAVQRIRMSLDDSVGATALDGGALLDSLPDHLDRYDWIRLIKENLGTEPTEIV